MSDVVETVIVGAGPAGLATAACLQSFDRTFIVVEKEQAEAASWRSHYDRLHLHTDRDRSALPMRPLPRSYPRYPSRDQVIAYLEDYRASFQIEPRFAEEVRAISRVADNWNITTTREQLVSRNVVLATGYNSKPIIPSWPGQDEFPGTIEHSKTYRSGTKYTGLRVLVVGMGNSGGEIALDLCEHGIHVSVSVRGPVNVIPRELFGIPILALGKMTRKLPPRISDALTSPILRVLYPDLQQLGFAKHKMGPQEQIAIEERIPLIDIGTIEKIRSGAISVRPGIARFNGDGVQFVDGRQESFDAVILATGYTPGLNDYLQDQEIGLDLKGAPETSELEIAPGLFACGFDVSPNGMLLAIAGEAKKIARTIAERESPE